MNHRTIEEQGFEIWLDSEGPSLLKKQKVPGGAVAVIRNDRVIY
jgi:hypothetical protein